MTTWYFPWGQATLMPAPPDMTAIAILPTQWSIVCGGSALKATMRRRVDREARVAVADAIGRAVSDKRDDDAQSPVPLAILIALAILAMHDRIPTDHDLRIARDIARSRTLRRSPAGGTSARLRDVRSAIAAMPAVRMGTLHEHAIRVSATAWDYARALLALAERSWNQLADRDAARQIGRASVMEPPASRHVADVLTLALIAPGRWPQAPAPFAESAHASEIWLDWSAIAAGPASPDASLWTHGMGAAFAHPLQESNATDRALGVDVSERIASVAAALLAERDRPLPRLIGQLVRIPLPTHLLPAWETWEISSFVAQIHAEGMYLSLRSPNDDAIAVAWWDADPESWRQTPLTIPPAAWVLTHATAAAIWHDLCAEAIRVSRPNPQPQARDQDVSRRESSRRAADDLPHPHKPSRMALPPRRYDYPTGTWGDAEEHDRIRDAIARSAHYRRLPPGWHEREEQRDAMMRRRAAADRAQQAGFPPPPPGYTFVRAAFVAGEAPSRERDAPRPVRCQGLLALSLLVREEASIVENARAHHAPASPSKPPQRSRR